MKRAVFSVLFAALVIGVVAPHVVRAFGVSPPFVNASKLLRGSRYEAVIFLVQGNPVADTNIKATFDVPEKAKGWFSIDQKDQFTIPAGVQQFPLKVTITVPKDAELGIYNGYLRVVTVPPEQGGQVSVAVGARIDLNLTVGEGVVQDYTIRKVDILDIRQGDSPQIVVTMQNTGNVPVAGDRATFDLSDKYNQVRLGYGTVSKLPEVPAFETADFVVEFPLDVRLAVGEYWGEARIYRGQTVVAEIHTIFNVTERKVNYLLYGELLGGVIVLGAITIFIRKRRRA
jgi:hypothetical protein